MALNPPHTSNYLQTMGTLVLHNFAYNDESHLLVYADVRHVIVGTWNQIGSLSKTELRVNCWLLIESLPWLVLPDVCFQKPGKDHWVTSQPLRAVQHISWDQ